MTFIVPNYMYFKSEKGYKQCDFITTFQITVMNIKTKQDCFRDNKHIIWKRIYDIATV